MRPILLTAHPWSLLTAPWKLRLLIRRGPRPGKKAAPCTSAPERIRGAFMDKAAEIGRFRFNDRRRKEAIQRARAAG